MTDLVFKPKSFCLSVHALMRRYVQRGLGAQRAEPRCVLKLRADFRKKMASKQEPGE